MAVVNSNSSTSTSGKCGNAQKSSHQSQQQAAKTTKSCAELNLPQAIINKLMKEALEGNTKLVSSETKSVINKCTSIFILFITTKASEMRQKSNKRYLTSSEIIAALNENGFDNFVGPCMKFLEDFQADKLKKQKQLKETKNSQPEQPEIIEVID